MAKTEVILTHNIVGLGAESDHVKVAAGYARNYLLPQGLAVPVTGANKRRLEVLKQRRGEREAHEFNTMSELSKSITKLTCLLKVKTGDDGKMFGSVTAGTIAVGNASLFNSQASHARALALANLVLDAAGGIHGMAACTGGELRRVPGVGEAKAAQAYWTPRSLWWSRPGGGFYLRRSVCRSRE